ncbi:MAG: NUDIX domain-containing protein [Comamonadaceae bacterium]|nr:MAG: NUDIX domain-containing protein [Comamonadaceae bacterium]
MIDSEVIALTPQKFDVAVCVGRFQVFHNGHLALVRRALAGGTTCVVVIGSAFQARTPKNPFTWDERAAMIRAAVPEADRERLRFLPVRDYYDTPRWVAAVRQGVAGFHPQQEGRPPASVTLVGHLKDATSVYLHDFPGWTLDAVPEQGRIDSSALRDAWFGSGGQSTDRVDVALSALTSQVPASTLDFMRAWSALPYFVDLAGEWRALRDEKARWAGSPYPPMFVTVDAVVRCGDKVLLIRRGRAPGKGHYAVPGGFLEQRETVYQSALRELEEETGLRLLGGDMQHALKAVQVFDHPGRSQRGRVITHAHLFDLGPRRPPEVEAADDAASADWVGIGELLALEDQFHDDHFHILDFFFGLTTHEAGAKDAAAQMTTPEKS